MEVLEWVLPDSADESDIKQRVTRQTVNTIGGLNRGGLKYAIAQFMMPLSAC